MEAVAGVTAIETRGGAIPLPLSVTSCGLEVPLSTIVRVPVRDPSAPGLKDTAIVQLAPAAKVAGLMGQLWLAAKSARLVEMPGTVIPELWPFFKVTFLIMLVVLTT